MNKKLSTGKISLSTFTKKLKINAILFSTFLIFSIQSKANLIHNKPIVFNLKQPNISATSKSSPIIQIITKNSPRPTFFIPRKPSKEITSYRWHRKIVTTIFWVGETPTENNPVSNVSSSWDMNWAKNYGGYDNPDIEFRNNLIPKKFTPKQNPFYIALPYNDVMIGGRTKPEAMNVIPWYKKDFIGRGKTILKGKWVAIRYKGRTCYAQWEDCGPFLTDDYQYVFGNKRPRNEKNRGAGLDVSPAIRDYLGLKSMGQCDWRFVNLSEIPNGPWRRYGRNNHFANKKKYQIAKRKESINYITSLSYQNSQNNKIWKIYQDN